MTDAQPAAEREHLIRTPAATKMTAGQFFELCQLNPDWRFELTAQGGIIIMPPTGGKTGLRNARLTTQVVQWADRDGSGAAIDSSTAFELPNGAVRSPDAAWVHASRLAKLTPEERERFLPLCPDFVVELKSPSDYLSILHDKMQEYIANGARLGWLIDPGQRRVSIFRPGTAIEDLENPAMLAGDPVLPGFVLTLTSIWDPGL